VSTTIGRGARSANKGVAGEIDVPACFGGIDIYLFDQIQRGRISPGHRIMDAGCGGGRNVAFFLRQGYTVFAIDESPAAIAHVRRLAAEAAPRLPESNFRAEPLARTTFPDGCADVVISSAVLHFARDDAGFDAALDGSWRLVAPGGLFFCRLASTIGIEANVRPAGGSCHRRAWLPDGSERYLVDEAFLLERTRTLGGTLLDPLKTTVVQGQRAMTTWVVRRP
jgi:tellurite methyltransferase